ncbi:MAG: ATP-binding protein, partial [Saprospiraceae bacterium]|nr:ATP-binding protein [Saprospiraceae bacterium]
SEYRENLIPAGKYNLLRSAAIYGANASGKSNLLKALVAMRENIMNSVRLSSTSEIDLSPFILSSITENKPSYFEIIIQIAETKYRYGFEADRHNIHAEWLFEAKLEKEKVLFIRENNTISRGKTFSEGNGLEQKTKQNTLFLSVCDQFNGEISSKMIKWFSSWSSAVDDFYFLYSDKTHQLFQELSNKESILRLIKQFDLGIDDIRIKQEEVNQPSVFSVFVSPSEIKRQVDRVYAIHTKYDNSEIPIGSVELRMEEAESSGTNKLFNLSGFIFNCLNQGSLLVADELDAKLHPLMTRAIVRLFNDPQSNPNNAQLIFATHDTNLLSYGNFRRDQIYFTEKDQYGASDLYSLAEFKEEGNGKVRKDRSFQKDYIQGRYGAVPFIGDLGQITTGSWQKNEAEATL